MINVMQSDVLVLNYNISGGFAGWTMFTIRYNSNTRELYRYVRPPVAISNFKMELISDQLLPNQKSKKGETRMLTAEEDEKLKSDITKSGYFDSKEEPVDDPNTTEGYSYVLDITQGQRTRMVTWYEGVGGSATIPKSIEHVLNIITAI